MQSKKQKWVNEVLKSTDGMSRAATNDRTDEVISYIISSRREFRIQTLPDTILAWRIAASVVFLLLINIVTLYSYQNNVSKVRHAQAVATEFGLGQSTGADPGAAIFGN